jgi:hypothetical protein
MRHYQRKAGPRANLAQHSRHTGRAPVCGKGHGVGLGMSHSNCQTRAGKRNYWNNIEEMCPPASYHELSPYLIDSHHEQIATIVLHKRVSPARREVLKYD